MKCLGDERRDTRDAVHEQAIEPATDSENHDGGKKIKYQNFRLLSIFKIRITYKNKKIQFEKQSEIMDMKEEIMGDAIDDALGDPEDDAESDQIVNQVFFLIYSILY